MARTLTQVQTTLGLLQTKYDTLAARDWASMGARERQMASEDMAATRQEIEHLEALERQLQAEASTDQATPGVAYVQFQDPQ